MAYDPFKIDVAQEDQGNTFDPFAFMDAREKQDKPTDQEDKEKGIGTMLGSVGAEIAGSVATAAAAEKFVRLIP